MTKHWTTGWRKLEAALVVMATWACGESNPEGTKPPAETPVYLVNTNVRSNDQYTAYMSIVEALDGRELHLAKSLEGGGQATPLLPGKVFSAVSDGRRTRLLEVTDPTNTKVSLTMSGYGGNIYRIR